MNDDFWKHDYTNVTDKAEQEGILKSVYGPRLSFLERFVRSLSFLVGGGRPKYPTWQQFLFYCAYRREEKARYMRNRVRIDPGDPNFLYVTDVGEARQIATQMMYGWYKKDKKKFLRNNIWPMNAWRDEWEKIYEQGF